MFHSSPATWLAALSALAAWDASAQTAPAHPSSPAHEPAPPALAFRSALEGYRPFADEKAVPWKDANETVDRRGGWRAYAKEAAQEKPRQDGAPPDPHAGHAKERP